MMEDLDFTGGPWLLRNGMRVKELVEFNSKPNNIFTSRDKDYNLYWTNEGLAVRNDLVDYTPCSEFDITENLNNWKHNRKGNE